MKDMSLLYRIMILILIVATNCSYQGEIVKVNPEEIMLVLIQLSAIENNINVNHEDVEDFIEGTLEKHNYSAIVVRNNRRIRKLLLERIEYDEFGEIFDVALNESDYYAIFDIYIQYLMEVQGYHKYSLQIAMAILHKQHIYRDQIQSTLHVRDSEYLVSEMKKRVAPEIATVLNDYIQNTKENSDGNS